MTWSKGVGTVVTDATLYIILVVVVILSLSNPCSTTQLSLATTIGHIISRTYAHLVDREVVVYSLSAVRLALLVILLKTAESRNAVLAKLLCIFYECLVGIRITCAGVVIELWLTQVLWNIRIPVILSGIFSPLLGRSAIVAVVASQTNSQAINPEAVPDQLALTVDYVGNTAVVTCITSCFCYRVIGNIIWKTILVDTRIQWRLVLDV